MELNLPIGGIRRDVDDSAMSPGSFKDIVGALVDKPGQFTGIYRGRTIANFDGSAVSRFIQWADRYVRLKSNPSGTIQITDAGSYQVGPSGDGRACKFADYLPIAVYGDQALILIDSSVADPFTDSSCYLSQNVIEATLSGSAGTGSVTLTLSGAAPNTTYPTGMVPRYVLFDADAAAGALSAQIRPVTAYTASPGPATSITYTGDAVPAGTVRVRLLMGTSATDTFKPDGFFVWRGRLCAWKDEYIYYSGYPGSSSPYIASNVSDWTYWYALNVSTTGTNHNILQCAVANDVILAFTSTGRVFRFSGWPPVDGTDSQVVRDELHPDLSIPCYGAAAATNDGRIVYFIGTDGNLYSTDGEISQPVRDHEKLLNLTQVTAADQAVVFSGDTATPENVCRDDASKPSGLLYQFPCTFYLNRETGQWSTWQSLGFDSTGALVPMDDPASIGGIGVVTQDGREKLAVGSKLGIHILNDPDLGITAATDWYSMGFQTHSYAIEGTKIKTVVSVSMMADTPVLNRMGMAAPADSPMNLSNAGIVRARAKRQNTTESVFELYTHRVISNYVSMAVGYVGETLLDGIVAWPLSRTAMALGGSIRLMPVYLQAGFISRFDVLFSALTSCALEIYEDDGADAPDFASLIYSTNVKQAHAGLTGTGEYWHPFDVRLTLAEGTYWFGLRGTATVQRTPSSREIVDGAGATAHSASMFIARAIRELGCPNSAKKVTSLSANYNVVGRKW